MVDGYADLPTSADTRESARDGWMLGKCERETTGDLRDGLMGGGVDGRSTAGKMKAEQCTTAPLREADSVKPRLGVCTVYAGVANVVVSLVGVMSVQGTWTVGVL
jgi:hypothetical protein